MRQVRKHHANVCFNPRVDLSCDSMTSALHRSPTCDITYQYEFQTVLRLLFVRVDENNDVTAYSL